MKALCKLSMCPGRPRRKPSHTGPAAPRPSPSLRAQPTSGRLNHSRLLAALRYLSQRRRRPCSAAPPPPPTPPPAPAAPPLLGGASFSRQRGNLYPSLPHIPTPADTHPFTSSFLSAAFICLLRPLFLSHPFSERTIHQALFVILAVFLQKGLNNSFSPYLSFCLPSFPSLPPFFFFSFFIPFLSPSFPFSISTPHSLPLFDLFPDALFKESFR